MLDGVHLAVADGETGAPGVFPPVLELQGDPDGRIQIGPHEDDPGLRGCRPESDRALLTGVQPHAVELHISGDRLLPPARGHSVSYCESAATTRSVMSNWGRE